MPTVNKHLEKVRSNYALFKKISTDTDWQHVDWFALVGYYTTVHCAEAFFAKGLDPEGQGHSTTHYDRLARLKKHRDVYHKMFVRMSVLFQFSLVARYMSVVCDPFAPPDKRKYCEVADIESFNAGHGKTADRVAHLVGWVVKKTEQLLPESSPYVN